MKALFGYLATAFMASAIVTAAAPVNTSSSGEPVQIPYYPPYMSHFSYPLYSGLYPTLPPVGSYASVFNDVPFQSETVLVEDSFSN